MFRTRVGMAFATSWMGGYVQDARWYGLRNIMTSSRARCKITLLARSLVLKIDRSIATHAARPHCHCKAQGCVIPRPLLGLRECPDLARRRPAREHTRIPVIGVMQTKYARPDFFRTTALKFQLD